jgi:hypothetical protein
VKALEIVVGFSLEFVAGDDNDFCSCFPRLFPMVLAEVALLISQRLLPLIESLMVMVSLLKLENVLFAPELAASLQGSNSPGIRSMRRCLALGRAQQRCLEAQSHFHVKHFNAFEFALESNS